MSVGVSSLIKYIPWRTNGGALCELSFKMEITMICTSNDGNKGSGFP
jgi:hypothetical protein